MNDYDNEKTNMDSLVSVLATVEQQGYTTQFKVIDQGLESLKTHKVFQPQEVKINRFYRFEGESNQDDSAILYAIETADGEKGTLVNGYGPTDDPLASDFIKLVHEIHK